MSHRSGSSEKKEWLERIRNKKHEVKGVENGRIWREGGDFNLLNIFLSLWAIEGT